MASRPENGFKILLVEDSLEESLLVQALVEREGLGEVRMIQDGLTAQDLVQDGAFDLVICDLNLPGVDGIGVVRAAKRARPARSIVVTTGYRDPVLHSRARAGGADRVFTKPLDRDEFLAALRELLPAGTAPEPKGAEQAVAQDSPPASGASSEVAPQTDPGQDPEMPTQAGAERPAAAAGDSDGRASSSGTAELDDMSLDSDLVPQAEGDDALVMDDPDVPGVGALDELSLLDGATGTNGDADDTRETVVSRVRVDNLIVDLVTDRDRPRARDASTTSLSGVTADDPHPRTVLAVGAFPGDVMLGCGGILAGHLEDGWTVIILTLTRRFGALPDLGSAAHQAARRLGAKLVLGDVQPDDHQRAVALVRSLVELHRPGTVLTPSPHDKNRERVAAHDAAVDATPEDCHVYAYQTATSGLSFRPNLFASIEDVLEAKVRALEPFAEYPELQHLSADQARAIARSWAEGKRHRLVEPLEMVWTPSDPGKYAREQTTAGSAAGRGPESLDDELAWETIDF